MMTKEDAFRFLEMYRNWDVCQMGNSEDERLVLDERRKTIIKAYKTIQKDLD